MVLETSAEKDEIDMTDEMFNLLLINKKITADHTFIITAGFDPLHDEAEKYALFTQYEQ